MYVKENRRGEPELVSDGSGQIKVEGGGGGLVNAVMKVFGLHKMQATFDHQRNYRVLKIGPTPCC